MKRSLALIAVAALGCGEATTPAARTADTPQPSLDASAEGSNAIREPAAVAERFVRAIVSGDRAAAARELTPNAAERVAREPELLRPLGLANAELRIGEVRLLGPAEAAVQVLITESGQDAAEEVGCLLKLGGDVWGVCGLASNPPDGGEPVVIGFESTPQLDAPLVDAPTTGAREERTAQGAAPSAIR